MAYVLRLVGACVPVAAHVYPGSVHAFKNVPRAPTDLFIADLKVALNQMHYAGIKTALNSLDYCNSV